MLKDCLSSLTCHVTLLAHVSATNQNHPETLGTVQLAARIHRIRRRRVKVSWTYVSMNIFTSTTIMGVIELRGLGFVS